MGKEYSGRDGKSSRGGRTMNNTGRSSTKVRSGTKSQKEYISLARTSSGNNSLYGESQSNYDSRLRQPMAKGTPYRGRS